MNYWKNHKYKYVHRPTNTTHIVTVKQWKIGGMIGSSILYVGEIEIEIDGQTIEIDAENRELKPIKRGV